jgi:hypothetical protein
MRSLICLYIIFIYFINYINCENITITVGERGLYFSPQNITAKYNDAVSILIIFCSFLISLIIYLIDTFFFN